MREAVRVETKHMPMLYKFLVQGAWSDPSLLEGHLRSLSPTDLVFAVRVDGQKFEQAMFVKLTNEVALTHKVIGIYSRETSVMLDMLCANCASHDPTIVNHIFAVPSEDLYNLKEALSNSRLGKFCSALQETDHGLEITVQYPDA